MERPLYSPPHKPELETEIESADTRTIDTDALYEQVIVDKVRLKGQIRQLLQVRTQVTLGEVLTKHPLQQGLAELVAYLSIAANDRRALFDDDLPEERVTWRDGRGKLRQADLPCIIFTRP